MPRPEDVLQTNAERIEWVLAHPRMSAWLKEALRGARNRDPVEVLNELEILNLLLRTECEILIQMAFLNLTVDQDGRARSWEKPTSTGQPGSP